jgi:hypothetical protein
MKTDQGARAVQGEMEAGEEVLDPENPSAVLSTVRNTINNQMEPNCLDKALRLPTAHPIRQSTQDYV